jgi:hypothetical protein
MTQNKYFRRKSRECNILATRLISNLLHPNGFLAKYSQGGRGVPELSSKSCTGSRLGFEGGQGELFR